jgi:multidrug efflux pump subunit AcrB
MAAKKRKRKAKGAKGNVSLNLGKTHMVIGMVVVVLLVGVLVYNFLPDSITSQETTGAADIQIASADEASAAVTDFSSDLSDVAEELRALDGSIG